MLRPGHRAALRHQVQGHSAAAERPARHPDRRRGERRLHVHLQLQHRHVPCLGGRRRDAALVHEPRAAAPQALHRRQRRRQPRLRAHRVVGRHRGLRRLQARGRARFHLQPLVAHQHLPRKGLYPHLRRIRPELRDRGTRQLHHRGRRGHPDRARRSVRCRSRLLRRTPGRRSAVQRAEAHGHHRHERELQRPLLLRRATRCRLQRTLLLQLHL